MVGSYLNFLSTCLPFSSFSLRKREKSWRQVPRSLIACDRHGRVFLSSGEWRPTFIPVRRAISIMVLSGRATCRLCGRLGRNGDSDRLSGDRIDPKHFFPYTIAQYSLLCDRLVCARLVEIFGRAVTSAAGSDRLGFARRSIGLGRWPRHMLEVFIGPTSLSTLGNIWLQTENRSKLVSIVLFFLVASGGLRSAFGARPPCPTFHLLTDAPAAGVGPALSALVKRRNKRKLQFIFVLDFFFSESPTKREERK